MQPLIRTIQINLVLMLEQDNNDDAVQNSQLEEKEAAEKEKYYCSTDSL